MQARKKKKKRLSNIANVIILGETRELKDELPKIVPKQKMSEENGRNLAEEKFVT